MLGPTHYQIEVLEPDVVLADVKKLEKVTPSSSAVDELKEVCDAPEAILHRYLALAQMARYAGQNAVLLQACICHHFINLPQATLQ